MQTAKLYQVRYNQHICLYDKGLYINYVILFWAFLDTPLPPVIMSSFDIPPTPPDDAIYVQDNP